MESTSTVDAERTSTAGGDLEGAITAFRRFAVGLNHHSMESLLGLSLTMPQFRTLRTIEQLGRPSGRQLARELRVSPAAVVPLCDRLEEQGYIERIRDRSDRRVWWFQLTASGTDVVEGLSAVVHQRIGTALATLSPSDRDTLIRIVNHIADALGPDPAHWSTPEHRPELEGR